MHIHLAVRQPEVKSFKNTIVMAGGESCKAMKL